MRSRPLSIAILACAGWAAASQALALGFGRIPESVAFGQTLDLAVPLRLEAGESLAPGCMQAEVHMGEQRLPPGALRLTLERRGDAPDAWRVRLRSAQVVQEPLVAVNLVVGCGGAVSRQFVVFADPPSTRAELVRVALAEAPLAAAAEPVVRAQAGTFRAPTTDAAPTATKPVRRAQAEGARARKPAVAARRPVAPRLKLDEPEELLKAATLVVAAQDAALASTAQAASAAEAAASAADQRLVAMQTNLKTMRDEAAVHRGAMEQMGQRLAQAEDQGRTQSLLAAAVAALALLALWLGWRMRALQRERQAAWWRGAAAAPALDAVPDIERAPTAPAALAAVPEPAPLPLVAPAEESLTRPVSVDDLIDLEQQAEFFLVLGEEGAAIDLLMSHLRGTGGTSPLPYLKLLQIFRRRDDRDAYERMCKRFGQHFDAVAPAWDADPGPGRELQDYPAALAALQAVWPRPLEAMAELEELLLRQRSGELFELPACRDVLMLYAVARELHRQDHQPTEVDLLLPLADGEGTASIFDGLGGIAAASAVAGRLAAPVDLDLSELPARQDSRFGGLPSVPATLS